MKKKINCGECGSDKVVVTRHKKITTTPKSVRKRHPNRRITYGYIFNRYTCECGNIWEVEDRL